MRTYLSMVAIVPVAAALMASASDAEATVVGPTLNGQPPIVIGHRGASGYRPEHTLEAYKLAIEQGADFIEPDLVATKDGVLVARHENEIGGTTNVGDVPGFAGRKTTKIIDGVSVMGWFTEDFTLAELQTLRARERIPAIRPGNTVYNDMFPVPTLNEVIDLVKQVEADTGRKIGIYPETKHPTYFDSIGLSLEEVLINTLVDEGFTDPTRVFIQSFEVGNLMDLDTSIMPAAGVDLPLVQLINSAGAPYDLVAAGDPRAYADLISDMGLEDINDYAQGIGTNKNLLIPRDAGGNLLAPTDLVARAHAKGLLVHGWTFRAEDVFLPGDFQGDPAGEIKAFLRLGMDGFFTDNPDVGVAAVPVPASLALFGLALAIIAAGGRRTV